MRRNGILPAIVLLTGLLLWTGCTPPVLRTPSPIPRFDEAAFWEGFPLPDDARVVPAAEGQELAFATGMIEPELFDFYAQWLREKGWSQQAPTEAMITLPHQRWRRDSLELLIELQLSDEDGRTIVRCQVQSDTK